LKNELFNDSIPTSFGYPIPTRTDKYIGVKETMTYLVLEIESNTET
jgi:hypothetical protein